MANTRTIPELSIDTQTLERLLLAVPIGDTIEYSLLTAAIGRDVQTVARHSLDSARRRVLRNERMVFEPVPNVGMKRLTDSGVVGLGRSYRSRIKNLARRGRRKLVCVQDFDALPNELKIEHNTSLAQLGAVQHFSSDRVSRKIAASIHETAKTLPLRDCLKAMRSSL